MAMLEFPREGREENQGPDRRVGRKDRHGRGAQLDLGNI